MVNNNNGAPIYSQQSGISGRRQHDESPEHMGLYVRMTNRVENNPDKLVGPNLDARSDPEGVKTREGFHKNLNAKSIEFVLEQGINHGPLLHPHPLLGKNHW